MLDLQQKRLSKTLCLHVVGGLLTWLTRQWAEVEEDH